MSEGGVEASHAGTRSRRKAFDLVQTVIGRTGGEEAGRSPVKRWGLMAWSKV